jgi:phospholipid/cholesterol/gamma-HCH transport system permease protein
MPAPTSALKSATPVRTVVMPERVTLDWVQGAHGELLALTGSVRLDFAQTLQIDTAGASLVRLVKQDCSRRGDDLVLANIRRHILNFLSDRKGHGREPTAPRSESFFVRAGDMTLGFAATMVEALSVLSEMMYWGTFGLLRKRDFRKGVLGEQMYQLGYKAVVIVGLLTFLVGIVVALQSAMFLRMYGAGIYLASMVGWTMLKEFGPLLTAIILAGRTGSATTAEIATMGVGEEIDALKTMGISHFQFVVVPKFWAITFTMPLLSILASTAGIFGAYLVSLFYLGISPSLFWGELTKNIAARDVAGGLFKSVVFSWLIIWIGSYYGLRVRGGAEAVGRETTASVVTCIFVIILADAVFSFFI